MTEEKISIPILVVDDDPVSRTLLERILIRAGYKVTAVENGPEALRTLNENFFRSLYPTG
jgi:CheY-like chemotaxis protein